MKTPLCCFCWFSRPGTSRICFNSTQDHGYDAARQVWNADIDRYPAVIARCASAPDVAAAVSFAVKQGLEIAVRGGGHSMSGSSVVDDGMMIDLSSLNESSSTRTTAAPASVEAPCWPISTPQPNSTGSRYQPA